MNINMGGTINADFMCGKINSCGLLGGDPVTVHHSLKDGIPAPFWMVVCVPTLRFIHIDARELLGAEDWSGQHLKQTKKREQFLTDLQSRFKSGAELWEWAEKLNLPRKAPNVDLRGRAL